MLCYMGADMDVGAISKSARAEIAERELASLRVTAIKGGGKCVKVVALSLPTEAR